MSRIVTLRSAIIESLRETVPDLAYVDWHDGEFDEDDVAEITTLTPAAYITVVNAPSDEQLTTRQMNAEVRCYVNIICSDADSREERGSDPQVWDLMEKVAVLANLNTWGVAGCAVGQGVRFKRLRDPKLRRQGIAVGCVEWINGLILGADIATQREYPLGPETTLSQAGLDFLGHGHVTRAGLTAEEDTDLTLEPDDHVPLTHEIT